MANQFDQKLSPFSQWIKGGNVGQQARESGVQFEIDVTQSGFNLPPLQAYIDLGITLDIPIGSRLAAAAPTVNPGRTMYVKGLVLIIDTVTINTPCQLVTTWQLVSTENNTVDSQGNPQVILADLVLQNVLTDLQPFSGKSLMFIPFDRFITGRYSNAVVEISTSRNIAAGEALTFTSVYAYGFMPFAEGLQIISP